MQKKRVRKELHCIVVSDYWWQRAKQLAKKNATSISGFIRQLLIKECKQEEKLAS